MDSSRCKDQFYPPYCWKDLLGGKINKDTFDVVSIGHIKTFDSFSAVKKGKHSRHLNAIFVVRVLQGLAGFEYFPYLFGVFHRQLVIELMTCEDNKVVTVSSMQKENKLTSADWNAICFSLVSVVKYLHLNVKVMSLFTFLGFFLFFGPF